jgi:hypothetical protein
MVREEILVGIQVTAAIVGSSTPLAAAAVPGRVYEPDQLRFMLKMAFSELCL